MESWGAQREMPEKVEDYGKVQREDELGCEDKEEYDALTNDPIRGISGSFFEHDLSTTGPHVAISIKGSLKEGPG